MVYNLVISSFAQQDTYDAFEWYELQRSGLGEELLKELELAYCKIAAHPEHYGFIDGRKDLRDFLLRRFPFLIVYRIKGNLIDVVAVHHAKKHPLKKRGSNI
ncbi:type II toxin-antitoxin system RelE/ParE family toxin [Parasediminibacterium paludis]|uniref:Type II toxin-antitoxin system RelE/ParE family toxin n=1 Tax=Parasediminibacterium paludis TaxID=908966 RepID=A0ABV8Q0R5_9BACT